MINFQAELNNEQYSVVKLGNGPCLVLAGAGSGKTRTITYRVAYLLEKGIKPENILLVTFTNKAAGEMKERILKLEIGNWKLGTTNALPWSGTFHHIAYRILRIYAPLLGYQNNFSVLDRDDSEAIIKLCAKEIKDGPPSHSFGAASSKFPSASVIGAIISYGRNAEMSLNQVVEEKFYQWSQVLPQLESIAGLYSQRKKEANAMDFDDLLVNLSLLLNDEKIRTKFATQFQYVLVDEFQDTNRIQASIVKKFSCVHKNLLVVGDDAQSIYSFRAADINNILNFTNQYDGAKIFKLETNYRSTKQILDVANSVISNNREQYKKNLRVASESSPSTFLATEGKREPSPSQWRGQGEDSQLPQLWPQIDQQAEANFIRKQIQKHLNEGVKPEEIAVLFRASHHSQMLEVELVQAGIDYDYRGGVRFFERAHIKDILSYLRVLNNLADTAAWMRVLMHEEGIGPAAAQKVIEATRKVCHPELVSGSSSEMLKQVQHDNVPDIASIGEQVLGAKAQTGWQNFLHIWNTLINTPNRAPVFLVEALLTSPYKDYLESEFVDSKDRLQDIKQLALFAERYDSLSEFLADATLQESFRAIASESSPNPSAAAEGKSEPSPSQWRGQGEDSSRNGKIILSTIHQAKGLEWSVVFIINLSSGSFPSERSLREENGLEEERRLFYVAVTRAKKYLYLTYPMAGGSFGDFLSGPSSFLNEIEPGLLEDHSLLSVNSTVLDDPGADVRYVSEDEEYSRKPPKIRPGSFLQDIDDL